MKNVIKSAIALSVINIFIKLFGPIKNFLIAGRFGVSRRLDAYFISQNCLDIILAIINFTIIILAVPLFTEEMENETSKNNFNTSIDSFLSQALLLSMIISVLFIGFSESIAQILPGFSNIGVQDDLAKFLNILSLTLIFSIPFNVITGYFYSRNKIALPSFLNSLPLFFVILFILFFSNVLDIYSLPIGFLFGNIVVFALIFFAFKKFKGGFRFSIKDTVIIKKIKKLIFPTMIFSAGGHINLLIDQVISSGIKDGAISILFYSQFIITLPFFLLTLPIITAIFPEMSRKKVIEGPLALTKITAKGFALLFAVLLPAFIILMFLRTSVIELFYNHGNFDPVVLPELARVLLAYGPAMLFLSFNSLLQRYCFTEKKLKLLMILTIISVIINIILDLLFASLFSITGIALATSINEIIYFLAIFWILRKKLGDIFSPFLKKNLKHILISGIAMVLTLYLFLSVYKINIIHSKINLLMALVILTCLSLTVYFFCLFIVFKNQMFKNILEK